MTLTMKKSFPKTSYYILNMLRWFRYVDPSLVENCYEYFELVTFNMNEAFTSTRPNIILYFVKNYSYHIVNTECALKLVIFLTLSSGILNLIRNPHFNRYMLVTMDHICVCVCLYNY